MANRAEEKAQRRAERMAREEAERKAAARKQRLTIIGGIVAGLAVAGVAIALLMSGNDGNGGGKVDETEREIGGVPIPEQVEGDYEQAAEAAGCKLEHPAIEGATHIERQFTPADYKSNPPHSGNHFPDWYDDGIYEPGTVPELVQLVHILEHGRIHIQYKPGTAERRVRQIEELWKEMEDGYHLLLYENTTGMPYEVAATAWGHVLGCPKFNDQVFDAIRTFRDRYIDKGPEQVP